MNTQNTETPNTYTPPASPVVPPPAPPQPVQTEEKKGSNLFIYILISLTLFILIGLGGYIFMSMTQKKENQPAVQNRVYSTPIPTTIPPTPTIVAEEDEISNLSIEDSSSELDTLEKDLNSL